jgi:hypothetical protein
MQRSTLAIAVGVLDDCDCFAYGVSQRRVLSGAYCGKRTGASKKCRDLNHN